MDNRCSREFVFLFNADRLAGASLSGMTIARRHILRVSMRRPQRSAARGRLRDGPIRKVPGLRKRERGFRLGHRRLWYAARWERGVWVGDSCGSLAELGDSHQIVGSRYEVGMHLHSLTTVIASAAQTSDGFQKVSSTRLRTHWLMA
jgi:hypothetical protein